ncbi:MAG: cytochrome c biogenesis protein [bacterium]
MKAIIIIIGVLFGIIFGLYPWNKTIKPLWWKIVVTASICLTIIFGIIPPIAGTFSDAYYVYSLGRSNKINVLIETKDLSTSYDKNINMWLIKEQKSKDDNPNFLIIPKQTLPQEFENSESIIVKTKFDARYNAYVYYSTVEINPFMTFPYIPDLEERVKILNFHVPMAWVAVLAYLISMIYSIQFLRNQDMKNDIFASSSAYLGTVFTILATVTGMIWAKFNWGAYWNWDPRQTSIFILLLIYFAYFALRSSVENKELKARLSSVYSIIAFVTVPFLVFVLPRIVSGLHPGSADDSSLGPIMSGGSDMLNLNKQIVFSLALASFTMLFFWILNIYNRYKLLREKYD